MIVCEIVESQLVKYQLAESHDHAPLIVPQRFYVYMYMLTKCSSI